MPADRPLRFTRVDALDLEILRTAGLTHDYPDHLHEEYSIGVVLCGTEVVTIAGADHVAVEGSVIAINGDEVHASRSIEVAYAIMKVKREVVRRLTDELTRRDDAIRFPIPVIRDQASFVRLRRLIELLDGDPTPFEAESAFVIAVGALIEKVASSLPNGSAPREIRRRADARRSVRAVREFLRDHFAENVSLADLTQVAGVTAFHLIRLFRSELGVPPHEYQTQLRVAHARRLIRSGAPIATAAIETGFCDQSHLGRRFKRIVGMTPSEYVAKSNIVQDRGRPRR